MLKYFNCLPISNDIVAKELNKICKHNIFEILRQMMDLFNI